MLATAALVLAIMGLVLGPALPSASLAASFAVGDGSDRPDAAPGDGNCATAPPVACTLRAAVEETNALPGADDVALPSMPLALSQRVIVADHLTVMGSGPATVIAGGAIEVTGAVAVSLSQLTVERAANPDEDGGGYDGVVRNDGGTVELVDVTLRRCRGQVVANRSGTLRLERVLLEKNRGSAPVYNNAAGDLELVDVSFVGNRAAGDDFVDAGALYNEGTVSGERVSFRKNSTRMSKVAFPFDSGAFLNFGSASMRDVFFEQNAVVSGDPLARDGWAVANNGTLTLENAAFFGGSGRRAGVVYNAGTLAVVNTTIARHRGLAGLRNLGNASLTNVTFGDAKVPAIDNSGALTVTNTIVAAACTTASGISSLGHNLEAGASCGFTASTDLADTDPGLSPVPGAETGTKFLPLLPGSPAIDAGDDVGCPPTDQRGAARPADGDGDALAVCDIGAYEVQP